MDFQPSQNVQSFHGVPRFGFIDSVAVLFADDDAEKENYLSGLLYFCIMILIFSLIWLAILFTLKVMFGIERVGCSAGGEAIDVSMLREKGVRRWERRQRMERSWKLQNIFMVCCMGIPAFSAVLINRGLDPVLDSLVQVSETSSVFRDKAAQAMNIVKRLNEQSNQLNVYSVTDMQSLCPSYLTSEWARESDFVTTTNAIKQSISRLGSILDGGAQKFVDTMHLVTQATDGIEHGIAAFDSNEWIFRVFLLVLNAVTALLFLGALLAKNRVNNKWIHLILANAVLPAFFFCMVGVVASACVISGTAVLNADFCAGGLDSDGDQTGPIGTLRDFSSLQGYNTTTLMRRSIHFYAESACDGKSPFSFVKDMSEEVKDAVQKVDVGLKGLDGEKLADVGDQCGTDAVPIARVYSDASVGLGSISKDLQEILVATTCSSIRPLLEDLVDGATCTDSVDGFAWMFSALGTMVILGLSMLSTRAALFNPIIPSSKKRRREKEFKQYKTFMEEHGYDTTKWLLDPKESEDAMNGPGELPRADTLETEEASSRVSPVSVASGESGLSPDDDDVNSGNAGSFGAQNFTFNESDSQRSSFKHNGVSVEGLSCIPEDPTNADDSGSVYSADSDDSSIHPPPSVLGSMMSSVSSMVSNIRRTPRHASDAVFEDMPSPNNKEVPILTLPVLFRQYHEKVASYGGNDDRSLSECSNDAGDAPLDTPRKTQGNPLLMTTRRSDESPKHPSTQPSAPQKSMSTLPRTIVNV